MILTILIILGIPLLLAALAFAVKKNKTFGIINSIGYALIALESIFLFLGIGKANTNTEGACWGFFYLDALSIFFLLVISIVALAAALYSINFIAREREAGLISESKAKFYYLFFNLFCLSMFFVPLVNNVGMLWVAIEMTTLISAFLVGFYNTKESVEAAWKYIIICSVGIIFALLGTILFSYAFSLVGGTKSLHWTDLFSAASTLNGNILKIAFIFIVVGYGTKAGLAPMHTWLPDAHSQAVAPISALLSGVLLKTALYAIIRFAMIVNKNTGTQYTGNLLLLLGIASLIIASGFVLVQKDMKRLLAYSSIEHVGIISIGLGLGTTLGLFGALLHVFNHAVTKSLMFFGAGTIVSSYKKHAMHNIQGVIKAMPFIGIIMILGVFALTGFPPFSIFVSEIMIIIASFVQGSYIVGGALLLCLAIIFGAFIFHFSKMLFGNMPHNMPRISEALSSKCAFLLLFSLMLGAGILAPLIFKNNFLAVIHVIQGM